MQLLNLKTIAIAGAFLVMAVSFSFWKGCDYGTERTVKEYRVKLDESELKYQRLLNAPPKVDTVRITRWLPAKPPRVDTVGTVAEEAPSPETPKMSMPYTIEEPGTLRVEFIPVASPTEQFVFHFKPSPVKVDTVYVTMTKTAVEYVEKTSTLTVIESVALGIGAGNLAAGGKKEITIGALGLVGLVEAGKYIFGGE